MISLLLTIACTGCMACGVETTYNYYLFHTWAEPTGHYLYEGGVKDYNARSRIDQFWREYTANPDCQYIYDRDAIHEIAESRQDTELLDYMKWLDTYIGAGQTLNHDRWDYPTKEELAESRRSVEDMATAASQYQGTRLRPQYMLLQMRANMLLEQHATNCTFWESTGKKLPPSVYRDLMENIYAGALFHTGQRERACDIFARQGDGESIQWALLKFRNLAGIRRIYADNPNSFSLYYLIDEFVNNVQEFTDRGGITEWDEATAEMRHNIQKEQQFRQQALDFVQFSEQVVREGKTHDPSLWITARAMIHYEMGMLPQALQDLQSLPAKKKQKKTSEQTQIVSRCVALLIQTANPEADQQQLVSELKWLTGQYTTTDNSYILCATHRILIHGLAARYHQADNHLMETAVWRLLDRLDQVRYSNHNQPAEEEVDGWNPNYATPYYYQLSQLTADELIRYHTLLQNPQGNALDQFVLTHAPTSSAGQSETTYYADLIGTRLLGEARFAEAIPYLEQVPTSFMESQNISYYLAHRNYHVERWYHRQRSKRDTEGPHQAQLSSNPKLDFCREALQLQDRLSTATNADQRSLAAYQLATMLYQASPLGECWYLSDYGNSCAGEGEQEHSPLFQQAKTLLEQSRQTVQFEQRLKSLYALAYLPVDNWWSESEITSWNGGTPTYHYTPNPRSYRYAALDALDRFAQGNPSRMDRYVNRCDVLRQFRKYK